MAWFNHLLPKRPTVPDSFLSVVSSDRYDSGRRALADFVKADRSLHSKIQQRFDRSGDVAVTETDKAEVAKFLTRYGMSIAEKGDYLRASSALLFALLVVPDFLDAVAGMAIIYHAWEDKIAASWAEHFRELTAPQLALHSYLPPSWEAPQAHNDLLRKQMATIISECKQHPEWRDSSIGVQRFGMSH
jgi:hypothetical protein